jgi:hypothetical protein
VDLPTLGRPTMPHLRLMSVSNQAGEGARREAARDRGRRRERLRTGSGHGKPQL